MAEHLSKFWYKIFLIILKYVPFLIGIVYLICVILNLFGITLIILPSIFYLSPISMIVWLCASVVFKCCIWHRLPIYYCGVVQVINTIDYYSMIEFSSSWLLFVYLITTIIFILLGMYFKNKYNVKRKNVKTSPS